MTTPRSPRRRATAGVGSTPASTAEPPAATTPRANASPSASPERARVLSDEDAPAARPEGRGLPEPLHELLRQELADDAAHPVGAEVLPPHEQGP